jgi:hypothetical protein
MGTTDEMSCSIDDSTCWPFKDLRYEDSPGVRASAVLGILTARTYVLLFAIVGIIAEIVWTWSVVEYLSRS